jgi:adenylate cyclase
VLVGVADDYLAKGDTATGLDVAEEALIAAERSGEPFDLVSAHEEVGVALLFQGHFSQALTHFEHSVASYDPDTHGPLAYAVGFDRGLFSQGFVAWCHTFLGRADQALLASERALTAARRIAHPFSLMHVLYTAAHVHFERGEPDRLRECVEEIAEHAETLGFPLYLAWARILQGWLGIEAGELEAGIAEMELSLEALTKMGAEFMRSHHLAMLADGLWRIGRHDDALGTLVAALSRAEQHGQHYNDAELHRMRAEVLLDMKEEAAEEAETTLYRSLEVARAQEAKTYELRAATSLARLWRRYGKRDQAHALLAPLHAWFTEGFETHGLRAAKALLVDLE